MGKRKEGRDTRGSFPSFRSMLEMTNLLLGSPQPGAVLLSPTAGKQGFPLLLPAYQALLFTQKFV